MTKLEQEIKTDFELYSSNKTEYQIKVDEISKKLKLFGENSLQNDFLPTYVVGNYEDCAEKFVLFSLNPGFNLYSNKKEKYKTFCLNFLKNVQSFSYYR